MIFWSSKWESERNPGCLTEQHKKNKGFLIFEVRLVWDTRKVRLRQTRHEPLADGLTSHSLTMLDNRRWLGLMNLDFWHPAAGSEFGVKSMKARKRLPCMNRSDSDGVGDMFLTRLRPLTWVSLQTMCTIIPTSLYLSSNMTVRSLLLSST